MPVGKGTIFTVLNLNDSNLGSLRSNIIAANSSPGLDTIVFAVAGQINLLSPMNPITDAVRIDGSTALGYAPCGPPTIILNGSGAGSANGIQLLATGSGSSLIALNVQGFALNGIQLIDSDANTIQGCFVGLTAAGMGPMPNGLNGIQMEGGSDFNLIGGPVPCQGNVFSGNGGSGISVNFSSTNTFSGNLVGTNATGMAAVGNGGIGILLINGSNDCVIGGSTQFERNIVANNGTGLGGNGINVDGSANTIIRNNYVGIDITGTVAMGNAENGIAINAAPGTIIGGTGPDEGNIISNHNFHAIVLNGGSNNVTIQGNMMGTDATGSVAMGNDDSGVIVINSTMVTIGGSAPGAGNLLSGSLSEYGIFIISSNNVTVHGNLIGTDITGTLPIPNFDGGIRVDFFSNDNFIGGTGAGEGNTIAFNTGYGVGVLSADCDRNLITRNSFFCNTGDMIELSGLGNDNHPAPVVSSFTAGGATGTASANDIIELYYDSTCTASCQGKDFIGSVTANGAGTWSYTGPLNTSRTLVTVAIRTALPPTGVNNTSEATCTIILPVEWASFTAELTPEQEAQLDWETASESNASHFEVERSLDGQNFEAIGQVQAENLDQGSSYRFFDPTPQSGLNSYRLRQVDLNGDFSYSEVRTVLLEGNGLQFAVAPNPADDQLTVFLSDPGQSRAQLILTDETGRLVQQHELELQSGTSFQLSSTELPSGLYFLTVVTPSGRKSKKISILH